MREDILQRIERYGQLCEHAMQGERIATIDGDLIEAAEWADAAGYWSEAAFEAARSILTGDHWGR